MNKKEMVLESKTRMLLELINELEDINWEIGYDFGISHMGYDRTKEKKHGQLVEEQIELGLKIRSIIRELKEVE